MGRSIHGEVAINEHFAGEHAAKKHAAKTMALGNTLLTRMVAMGAP
jgi:hypothetical protein